jgi:thioredoxin 1
MLKKFLFSSILLMGTLGAVENSDKQKDIVELIRLSSLNPEQLDQVLPQMVQLTLGATESDSSKIVAELKEKMLSDEFIKKYVPAFDKNFSHEEIKTLIAYYKEDAVKKLAKVANETILPIYAGVNGLLAQYVKAPADSVVSITKNNFQEEVKEFEGSVVLEAYSLSCVPCKALSAIFSALSKEVLGENVKFCKFDIGTEFELAKELKIQSVPTILFIKDGKVIDRQVGLVSKDDLKKKIEHL